MHAHIDSDRIAYAFGGMKDEEGWPLDWSLVQARIDSNIGNIFRATGARDCTLYLTSDDRSNYRYALGTIRSYKGHRPTDKPFWYSQIRNYLMGLNGRMVFGMEADDAIGIALTLDPENAISCSVDKDLDNIPGKHYNEIHPEKGVYLVSETDALHNFYCQLALGDRVDNIHGLYSIGPKSQLLVDICRCSSELDMYLLAVKWYKKYYGNYWKQFLWENASLLWIKRSMELPGEKEVQERLEKLFLEASELEVA